jgi:hypothetical protein
LVSNPISREATKEIASNWWTALPENNFVECCSDLEGRERNVNEYNYRRKDGGTFLTVRQHTDPQIRMEVNTRPSKKGSRKWEINVMRDFNSKLATSMTAEIVEETLIKSGAPCVLNPIRPVK